MLGHAGCGWEKSCKPEEQLFWIISTWFPYASFPLKVNFFNGLRKMFSFQVLLIEIMKANFYLFILFINLFKVDNDKRDTVHKNTHKIAKG